MEKKTTITETSNDVLGSKEIAGIYEACKVIAKLYKRNGGDYNRTLYIVKTSVSEDNGENAKKLLDATLLLINKGVL